MPKATAKSQNQLAKREQILQGAMQVFLRSGFAGTSMDRVAAEAGVSKQTIYSHFRDKEGLFKALIEQATIDRFATFFGSGEFAGSPTVLLRQLAETYFTQVANEPNYVALLRIIISESERFPALAKLYNYCVVERGRQLLSDYLRSQTEFTIADPEAVAQIFFGSLVSFVIVQEMLYGKEFQSLTYDRLIDSLINSVLAQRSDRAD